MNLRNIVRTALPEIMQVGLKKGYSLYLTQKKMIKRYLQQRQYAGSAVECPFCEKTFSQFTPTGALERPFWKSPEGKVLLKLNYICVANALCPQCGSGERHRLLYFYLRDRMNIFECNGLRLLDVAPDDFLYRKLFSKTNLEYISIDISPIRNPAFVMDITSMGFKDDVFDAIICYHVLEHILKDIQAMRELRRVLKPGGWAIIQVPIWAEKTVEDPSIPREEYVARYGHPDHVRRYGPDFVDRLTSIGFKIILDRFPALFSEAEAKRFGIFPDEYIHLCQK